MEKKAKKILFITAPYHCGVVEVAGSWPPLGLAYLGAQAIKAGWEAEIYDAMTLGHTIDDIKTSLKNREFDIIAAGSITPTLPDTLKLFRVAREIKKDCITLLGGVHPTFSYEEILNDTDNPVDYIIKGEGELPLFQFLSDFDDIEKRHRTPNLIYRENGVIIQTPSIPLIDDLDCLEVAWHLLDWDTYKYYVIPDSRLGAISSSRGCSFGCTFCSQQRFWNKTWRGRKAESVVDEIKGLNEKYRINVFLFTDEYPTSDRDRWEKILDLIIAAELDIYILMETRVEDIVRDEDILDKYRQAGVIHIYVGAEATDQDTLDKIKKEITVSDSRRAISLIAKYGMISETSFVLGFPDETPESIEKTFRMAREFNPDFAHFLAITPWPYADLYQEVKKHIRVFDYSMYNLIEPIIKPKKMTLDQIDLAIIDCYRRFYMPKMLEFRKLKDPFIRDYLLTSMKLIMKSSFLRKKFMRLGVNPKALMGRVFEKSGLSKTSHHDS